jgi:predicted SprT family Zn-dependent metalloprotease
MTKEEILKLTRNRLSIFGVFGWKIILTKSIRTFAEVIYNKKQLKISWKIFSILPKSILLETVNHEIAHILAGKNNPTHGKTWQEYCKLTSAMPMQFVEISNVFYKKFPPKYIVKHSNGSLTEYLSKPRKISKGDKIYLWSDKKIRMQFLSL